MSEIDSTHRHRFGAKDLRVSYTEGCQCIPVTQAGIFLRLRPDAPLHHLQYQRAASRTQPAQGLDGRGAPTVDPVRRRADVEQAVYREGCPRQPQNGASRAI